MLCLDKLPNSQPEERVALFLRRHWIDLLRVLFFSFLMLLVPVAIYGLIQFTGLDILSHPIWGPALGLGLLGYLFVIYAITITEITDYWLDVWIVTTERILNTEQHGLFNRLASEVHLDQVQDVTSETKGLLETFLTYGDVYIQTAAERERFQFKDVDNPDDVKITISQLVSDCKTTHHHDPRRVAQGIGANPTQQQDEKISL